eukprot:g1761.t1
MPSQMILRSVVRAGVLGGVLLSAWCDEAILVVSAAPGSSFVGQVAFRDFVTQNSLGVVHLVEEDVLPHDQIVPGQHNHDDTSSSTSSSDELAFSVPEEQLGGIVPMTTTRGGLTLGDFLERVGQVSSSPRTPNSARRLSISSSSSRPSTSSSTAAIIKANNANAFAHRHQRVKLKQLPASRFWFSVAYHVSGLVFSPVEGGGEVEPVDLSQPFPGFNGATLGFIDPVALSWTIVSEFLTERSYTGYCSLLASVPHVVWKMILLPEEIIGEAAGQLMNSEDEEQDARSSSFFASQDLARTDRAVRKRVGGRLLHQLLKGEVLPNEKVWVADRRLKIGQLLHQWHAAEENRIEGELAQGNVVPSRNEEFLSEVDAMEVDDGAIVPAEGATTSQSLTSELTSEEQEFQELVRRGLAAFRANEPQQMLRVAESLREILKQELDAHTAQVKAASKSITAPTAAMAPAPVCSRGGPRSTSTSYSTRTPTKAVPAATAPRENYSASRGPATLLTSRNNEACANKNKSEKSSSLLSARRPPKQITLVDSCANQYISSVASDFAQISSTKCFVGGSTGRRQGLVGRLKPNLLGLRIGVFFASLPAEMPRILPWLGQDGLAEHQWRLTFSKFGGSLVHGSSGLELPIRNHRGVELPVLDVDAFVPSLQLCGIEQRQLEAVCKVGVQEQDLHGNDCLTMAGGGGAARQLPKQISIVDSCANRYLSNNRSDFEDVSEIKCYISGTSGPKAGLVGRLRPNRLGLRFGVLFTCIPAAISRVLPWMGEDGLAAHQC